MSPARRLCLIVVAGAALACPGAALAGFDDLDDLVFVANRTSPAIAVVDSTSDRRIGEVATADIPERFVLAGAAGMLIASHAQSNLLSVVDLRSGELQRRDVGIRPGQLQTSPDGRLVAIAGTADDAVVLLPLDDDQALRRIDGLAQPGDLVFDRDGGLLFVANRATAEVAVIGVGAARVAQRIALDRAAGGVHALVRTPGGEIGFALHGANGRVSAIDLRARRGLKTIALSGPALRAYPTADSQHLLVPNERDRTVSLISTWSLAESARLPGASAVAGINTGMFDSLAVVISPDEDKALFLDLLERRPLGALALPSQPATGVSAAAGTKLYVALAGSDRLAVIDLRARRLLAAIEGVGEQPWAVNMANALSYCH